MDVQPVHSSYADKVLKPATAASVVTFVALLALSGLYVEQSDWYAAVGGLTTFAAVSALFSANFIAALVSYRSIKNRPAAPPAQPAIAPAQQPAAQEPQNQIFDQILDQINRILIAFSHEPASDEALQPSITRFRRAITAFKTQAIQDPFVQTYLGALSNALIASGEERNPSVWLQILSAPLPNWYPDQERRGQKPLRILADLIRSIPNKYAPKGVFAWVPPAILQNYWFQAIVSVPLSREGLQSELLCKGIHNDINELFSSERLQPFTQDQTFQPLMRELKISTNSLVDTLISNLYSWRRSSSPSATSRTCAFITLFEGLKQLAASLDRLAEAHDPHNPITIAEITALATEADGPMQQLIYTLNAV